MAIPGYIRHASLSQGGAFSRYASVQMDHGTGNNRVLLAWVMSDQSDPNNNFAACHAGCTGSGSTAGGVAMTPVAAPPNDEAGRQQGRLFWLAGASLPAGNLWVVGDATYPDRKPGILAILYSDSDGGPVTLASSANVSQQSSSLSNSVTASGTSSTLQRAVFVGALYTAATPTAPTVASSANNTSVANVYERNGSETTTQIAWTHTSNGFAGGTMAVLQGAAGGGGDTTPPTLTSPAGAGGVLTCSGSVSTNEGTGTLYSVVTASATAPSAAQVKLGQDNTGSAALRVVSQSVVGTGVQTIASGAVTAGTRFRHDMHEDAAGNQSAVVSTGSFVVTAVADVTVPTLTGSITPGVLTSSSIQYSWPVGADNVAVTSYERSLDGGSTWLDIGNVLTRTDTGLVQSTTYAVRVRAKDAAGNVSTPALSASISTTAAGTYGMTFGPFVLNTGAGQRAPGAAYDWWAFSSVVIGGDIDSAIRRRGSGSLNGSGLAVIAGLPVAGSWEVQLRFPGDAEPEKGTMRDTLTAA